MSSNSVVGTLPRVVILAGSGGSGGVIDQTPVYYEVSTALTSSDYNKHVIANQDANAAITLTLPAAASAPDGTQIRITSIADGGLTTITPMPTTYVLGEGDTVTLVKVDVGGGLWIILSEAMVPVSYYAKMTNFTANNTTRRFESDTVLFTNSDVVVDGGAVTEEISPAYPGVYKVSINASILSASALLDSVISVDINGSTYAFQVVKTIVNTNVLIALEVIWKYSGPRGLGTATNAIVNLTSGAGSTNWLNVGMTVTRLSIG